MLSVVKYRGVIGVDALDNNNYEKNLIAALAKELKENIPYSKLKRHWSVATKICTYQKVLEFVK